MASNLVSKLFRPHLTQLVSCSTLFHFVESELYGWFYVTALSSLQVSLRSGCLLRGKGKVAAAMCTRCSSSGSPPEKISRYPIPYKKDLPYDIAELMEEVESKVYI